MKEQKIQVKNKTKMIAYVLLVLVILSSLILGTKLLPSVSLGLEEGELHLEAQLEKYINYKVDEKDQGTLVQYNITGKVEKESNNVPIKNSEVVVNLKQIDGKYPNQVKAITKADGIEELCEYDSNSGKVTIKTQGQIETILLCYYDTYTQEAPQRNINLEIAAKATLDSEENITKEASKNFEIEVAQDIGTLTSIDYETQEIVNGYMKSNRINGTQYQTPYKETQKIIISKKEAQEKLEVTQNDTFIKVNSNQEEIKDLNNGGNLVYKSTKINQEDLKNVLGEEGSIEILDENKNQIAILDKDTAEVNYESQPQEIIIKTSNIQKEGILKLEHQKEIKSTMTDIENTKIKTKAQITAIKKEETINTTACEKIIDIKDAKTNINMTLNNAEWTNKQQNEITFDIQLNANSKNDNMFKNPKIQIELPNQVEKVILQNSNLFYPNGLELQEPYIETNSNGNTVIVANLTGAQTAYSENALELSTDIKIVATIILKKDIESTQATANVAYENQYTIDGNTQNGNLEVPIKIENYQEEEIKPIIKEEQAQTFYQAKAIDNVEETIPEDINIDDIKLEVAPIKGETRLEEGNTIYEGEYIKYGIKLTNTSEKDIQNVKVVGSIPQGTTYGELKADYVTSSSREYNYEFNNTLTEKEIEIGTLKAGESVEKFYEVQANDLEEGKIEQEIISNIKAYIGKTQVATYEMKNSIKPAEVKIFLATAAGNAKDQWIYRLSTTSAENKEVTVVLKKPKEFTLDYIVQIHENRDENKSGLEKEAQITEDEIRLKIQTNEQYSFVGDILRTQTTQETESSEVELTAVASIEMNNQTYQSNENRIPFVYESVSISMTSENEGEEIKYKDEINYEIKVSAKGRTNSLNPEYSCINANIKDFLPEGIEPVSVTYDNWLEEIETLEDGTQKVNGEYHKAEPITKDIYTTIGNQGERLADVNVDVRIPFGESVTIRVKATADEVYEKTKIENSATVTGYVYETVTPDSTSTKHDIVTAKTSNIISHTILPEEEQETPEEPENPEEPEEPEDPNQPSNPNNPGNIENPEAPEQKYKIEGKAWLDENEDGIMQAGEKALNGITVMLVDTKSATTVKENVQTGTDGTYRFSDIEKGDYVVAFRYDTNQYRITNGNSNASATTKEITLNGETMKVGVIDVTNLNQSVTNKNIGLVQNKVCDFKLDKSIQKITVSTKKGTKQYDYQDQKLAKIEVKAKEIEGATVVIEYKIVVTNEGELPATVGKVIDYLPEGLAFSSELNKNWSTQTNGQLINTSLSNRKMEAGESVELTLIATKKMTSTNTGTFTNAAEIGDISNALNIADRDSTPGNKVKTEDDYSEAEVILSVSTGIAVYLSIGTIIAVMIGIAVILAKKYGILNLGKISLLGLLLAVIVISNNQSVNAAKSVVEKRENIEYGEYISYYAGTTYEFNFQCSCGGISTGTCTCTYFAGGPTGSASCIDGDRNPGRTKTYAYDIRYGMVNEVTEYHADRTLKLKKQVDTIGMQRLGENNYLFGPITFNCDAGEAGELQGYEVIVRKAGEDVGYTICNRNGEPKELKKDRTRRYNILFKNFCRSV